MRLEPDTPELRVERAAMRVRAGDHRGAIEDLEAVVARLPTLGRCWAELGRQRWRVGDLAGADEALSRALELGEEDGATWGARGIVRLERGELEGARADLRRALELMADGDPRRPDLVRALERAEGEEVSPPSR